jgi:hypothetical protein
MILQTTIASQRDSSGARLSSLLPSTIEQCSWCPSISEKEYVALDIIIYIPFGLSSATFNPPDISDAGLDLFIKTEDVFWELLKL